MSIDTWLPTLNKTRNVLTYFGISVNAILVPVIFLKSPKDLGLYKYMMIYISTFEIFFGCVELLTIPDFFTKDSAFFVMVDPAKTILPQFLIQTADLLFCGSFAVSLGIFGFQFAYRYQVLNGNSSWTSSRPLNFLFWLGSPLIFATIWSAAIAVFMPLNNFAKIVLIRESVFPSDVELDNIGFCGALFYPKSEDGTEVINWDSMRGVAVTTTILISSEITMFFFALKCFLATKSLMNQSGHSKNFRHLQWQLFYALALQTLIPITLIQGPFSTIYMTTLLLDCSTPLFGNFLAFSITLYLAIDALPTIFIIKHYRQAIFGYFKQFKIVRVQPKPYQVSTANIHRSSVY
ncbi:Seven TM Receptor [Caenorhabditis elegans]|uniref:Seven TM Receptor n=1 Tax=Caenorhabditis elegans TaxID=6239 RepID=O62029_CAEEL|nr:Seven TM Receptor [Caenorhabditis elegans]CAB07553.2 Seven TM Receptor [Caenorhabditis elegans]|eukprot:NP_507017.2 Seven TM Receptor [Caenorhabditis elegans]